MKTMKEQGMFELIDQMELDDITEELLHDPVPPNDPLLIKPPASREAEDTALLNRIKARTLSRIAGTSAAPPNAVTAASGAASAASAAAPAASSVTARALPRRRGRKLASAVLAAAIVLFGAGILIRSPEVQAELKKVLRYLPGLGMVQEGDAQQETLVLEKPYEQTIGSGKLTVDAIILQENGSTIVLKGNGVPVVQQFQAEIGSKTYTFRYAMLSSSSDWYGKYTVTGSLPLRTSDQIILHIAGTTIGPLQLVPPRSADDLVHLGNGDTLQDVKSPRSPPASTKNLCASS